MQANLSCAGIAREECPALCRGIEVDAHLYTPTSEQHQLAQLNTEIQNSGAFVHSSWALLEPSARRAASCSSIRAEPHQAKLRLPLPRSLLATELPAVRAGPGPRTGRRRG